MGIRIRITLMLEHVLDVHCAYLVPSRVCQLLQRAVVSMMEAIEEESIRLCNLMCGMKCSDSIIVS